MNSKVTAETPGGDHSAYCGERDRADNVTQASVLIDELHHRLRNFVTVVQALVRQTQASTVDDFKERLLTRLGGLAGGIEAISGRAPGSVRLIDLIMQTVAPYTASERRQIALSGPDITTGPELALPLCLVLGELATNASKYGALTSAAGWVSIRWQLVTLSDAGPTLAITWREHDGPSVCEPSRRGFGRRLFERAFGEAGKVEVRFRPAGIDCSIAVALDRMCSGRAWRGEPEQPPISADALASRRFTTAGRTGAGHVASL